MRVLHTALLLTIGASPAFAQYGPVFVVPGKPGVPVIVNGIDASWSVVQGEFGLARPGQVTPVVIATPLSGAAPNGAPGAYYPADGKRPGYGRFEVVPPPNRPLPPPAPTYYRSWSSHSDPVPADTFSSPYGGYHPDSWSGQPGPSPVGPNQFSNPNQYGPNQYNPNRTPYAANPWYWRRGRWKGPNRT